jgi:hypothetical protein
MREKQEKQPLVFEKVFPEFCRCIIDDLKKILA